MVEFSQRSFASSEQKFFMLLLQKVLEMLGEPPCETIAEGQQYIVNLAARGIYSQELLEEIVD